MKRILVLMLVSLLLVEARAQVKNQRVFKMPANVEYSRGRVLVKIKAEYKDQVLSLAQSHSPARIKNVPLNSVAHLVDPQTDRHGARKKGARSSNPVIDISKYFSLKFDRNQNVEEYVNQLYATGYFEIVEPEYVYHTDATPNDPSIGQQYYLNLIKAFSAWDITQGDTTVVIAIVDSGGNLTHSDIAPNLYRNWAEYPPNGVDDDGNHFVDDYQGWDFMGADTLNINDPNFVGDNDPHVTKGGDISHGTWSAGCASAATNNGVGIAGVGYKTRLLFTKHSADNQLTTDASVYNAYSGILYAANQGDVRIINCSFGGSGQSQIIQDIINYVVLDRNCMIVAAAGNNGSSLPSYPAAYNNVLSVAATGTNDIYASFSNYGTTIDLSAPGVGIYTTGYNNVYNTVSGTSFSSPITAGAAALVWAKNPQFTALQVAEQLRVTADANALYTANPSMTGKLGKGRLDIYRALTLEMPSVRASNPKLINQNGFAPIPGDKAFLSFDFKNFLKSTSASLQISITSSSSAVTITKGTISPGIISSGGTVSNKLTPFELTIAAGAAQNTLVNLLITYTDGAYSDYQYESFYVNPSFIDVNSNLISTTVTGIGRIGYQDRENSTPTQGTGFLYSQNPMLFEMGLIMGTSATNIFNNVRSINNGYDQDFTSTKAIKQIVPGERSYSEIFGTFSNSATASSQVVVVDYRSLVMKEAPYDKFVILEYKIKNPTASALSNFYFGIFADWDITTNGAQDEAAWDNNNKMGYVYPPLAAAKPIAGIQLLTGQPAYYAIDNDGNKAGANSFGIYDGYTDAEKFKSISAVIGSGNERLQSAQSSGDDVSHVVSSGPYTIPAGQTITIAFALHGAPNVSELQTSARYADSLYNYTMNATKLASDTVDVCYNSPATLNASGATTIKWYDSFTGGDAIHTGSQLVTGNLQSDTVFYVSNADNSYESVRSPMVVHAKANPKILTSGSTILCQGDTVRLSTASADSTLWSNGLKTNTIKAYVAGKYSVKVKDNTLGCSSSSDTVTVVVNPKPVVDFSTSSDLRTLIPISFMDNSTDVVSWFWNFGDGQTSTEQNPVYTYSVPVNSVKLTATSDKGCSNSKTKSISVITAIDELEACSFEVFPNPFGLQDLHVAIQSADSGLANLTVTNIMGQVVLTREISTNDRHTEITIPAAAFGEGLYLIKLQMGNKTVVRKAVKAH